MGRWSGGMVGQWAMECWSGGGSVGLVGAVRLG